MQFGDPAFSGRCNRLHGGLRLGFRLGDDRLAAAHGERLRVCRQAGEQPADCGGGRILGFGEILDPDSPPVLGDPLGKRHGIRASFAERHKQLLFQGRLVPRGGNAVGGNIRVCGALTLDPRIVEQLAHVREVAARLALIRESRAPPIDSREDRGFQIVSIPQERLPRFLFPFVRRETGTLCPYKKGIRFPCIFRGLRWLPREEVRFPHHLHQAGSDGRG